MGLLHRPYEHDITVRVEAIEQAMSMELHRKGHARSLYLEHHAIDPLMDTGMRFAQENLGNQRPNPCISDGVVALFQLSIGSGEIPRLRSTFLQELVHSEGGNTIWQIVDDVVDFEEYRRRGTISLPDTAAEAKEYFEHIELERQLREGVPIVHP